MSTLNKTKGIDQRIKDLVFGYIRECTKPIGYTTFPVMINYSCLLYYHVLFDKLVGCGKSIKISSSNDKNNNMANKQSLC